MLLSKVSALAILAANFNAAADAFAEKPDQTSWDRLEKMMYCYRAAYVMDEVALRNSLEAVSVTTWDTILDPRGKGPTTQPLSSNRAKPSGENGGEG